jgi:hypothetical protein
MTRPSSTEYAPPHHGYVALVPEDDIVSVLEGQLAEMLAFLGGVTEAQGNEVHAPYTWSIKEVVGHVTDSERIFGYRALRFARADRTPLSGFDENVYARSAQFNRISLRDLVGEFGAVRRSHLFFFRNLTDDAWLRSGEANGNLVSVRALGYIIAGHARHHAAILRKRLSGRLETT